MRAYGRLWLCWWGALGTVGLLLGFESLPVLTVVGVSLAAAILVGAVTFVFTAIESGSQASTWELSCCAVQRGLLGALVVVTLIATSVTAGPLVLPLLLLVAVSSPWTIRCVRRLARRPHDASDSAVTFGQSSTPVRLVVADWAPAVQALSDEQLCTAWGASYMAMQAAPLAEFVELVTLRQAYLDDLERRNPAGMRAWFDSGARAAANPARYLAADHPG